MQYPCSEKTQSNRKVQAERRVSTLAILAIGETDAIYAGSTEFLVGVDEKEGGKEQAIECCAEDMRD